MNAKNGFSILIAAVFLAGGMVGCAEKVPLSTSANLPAAQGQAKVSKDHNGNTKIRLNVEHFAPPQRLQPPRPVYVVWIETPDRELYNLGQLKIKENLKGDLVGITPFKVFQLVITAEDYAAVTRPSSQVILRTPVIESND